MPVGRMLPRLMVVMAVATAFLLPSPAWVQKSEDTAALNAELLKLHREGRYADAIEVAKRLLAIREKVVGYRAQALTLANHTYGLALLVRSQLWLGPEFDSSFLGGGPPPIGTSKDTASFVLRQG